MESVYFKCSKPFLVTLSCPSHPKPEAASILRRTSTAEQSHLHSQFPVHLTFMAFNFPRQSLLLPLHPTINPKPLPILHKSPPPPSKIRYSIQCITASISTDPNITPSLSKHVATLSSTPPNDLAIAHQNTIQQSTTGLHSSSWSFLGADVRFGILGTVNSRPDWARKTWSANDGSMNILPRRQGNKRQAGTEEQEGKWEVLLALNEGDMTFVCNELRAIGLLISSTFGWRHKAK